VEATFRARGFPLTSKDVAAKPASVVYKDWPDESVKFARLDVIDIRGNGELWFSGEIRGPLKERR
jgi:hypothetical protein